MPPRPLAQEITGILVTFSQDKYDDAKQSWLDKIMLLDRVYLLLQAL
jgi:hypothetical protein